MSRPEKQIIERLGIAGLGRVIDDVMDQPRLVRLANSCGLKYPGMRTQSQARARIVADLVSRADTDEAARKAIFRALDKETRAAVRRWQALAAEERQRRLDDEKFLLTNGNLGLHLFLLARNGGDESLQPLLDLAGPRDAPADSPAPEPSNLPEGRLQRKLTELQRKVRHLEGQLGKARDEIRQVKKDLIQRKGELAESRMLAERLRLDLEKAQAAEKRAETERAAPSAPEFVAETLKSLDSAVRKLAAEQRKMAHVVTRRLEEPAAAPKPAPDTLTPLQQSVAGLQKEIESLKRGRGKALHEQAEQLGELRDDVTSLRKALTRPPSRRRSRGAEARVGVFIDVQNVYYAARRLKGKLDFEALLQAAVAERRLIHASAYIVESKDTDQSGFLAVLGKLGIEVRRKALRVRADGSMKGDWDMEVALDILDAAPNLDVVVLVSGDGDFTSLVKRVKRMGPRVEVLAFPRNTAKTLVEAADTFLPLDRKFMIQTESAEPVEEAEPVAGV